MHRPRLRPAATAAVIAIAVTALGVATATGTSASGAAAHPAHVSVRHIAAVEGGDTFRD